MPQQGDSAGWARDGLNRILASVQQRWSHVRAFLRGLTVAWVSVASALIGLLFFAFSLPAQDLFLEVRGSHTVGTAFWAAFYIATLLAWVLPVYVSASWILDQFRSDRKLAPYSRPVESWVLRSVPPLLAVFCLFAVLVGQVMSLSNSPPVGNAVDEHTASQLQQQYDAACGAQTERWSRTRCSFTNIDLVSRIIVVRILNEFRLGPEATIIALYVLIFFVPIIFGATYLWRYLSNRSLIARAGLLVLSLMMFSLLVSFSSGAGRDTVAGLIQLLLPMPVGVVLVLSSPFVAFSLLPFLTDLIPARWFRIVIMVLWWIVAVIVALVIMAIGAVFGYGYIAIEWDNELGIGQLAVLPLITLLVAWGLWRVLKAAALPSLASASGAGTRVLAYEPGSRRGAFIFYTVLASTVLVFAVQASIEPVDVADQVYRALMVPFLLGLLVPAATFLSSLSFRLQLPLVVCVIALLSWVKSTQTELNDARLIHRSGPALTARPELDDTVKRWREVNGCPSDPKDCPFPIIVSAAGGASRSAFLTGSVVGKLLDEEVHDSHPLAKQLFAISGVSGGSVAAVIAYAAMADSQTIARNGWGAPPCDRNAHTLDSDWLRSERWSWRPGNNDPGDAAVNEPVQKPDAQATQVANSRPPPRPDKNWRECLQLILAGDFLSPVFASLISNDLLGIHSRGDRAATLEKAWEKNYAKLTGQIEAYAEGTSTLQTSLIDLRNRVLGPDAQPQNWVPVLLLNGTSVTTGRRIVTSDVDTLLARRARHGPSEARSRLFRDSYDFHELTEISDPLRTFSRALFSPDGRLIATVFDDSVQLWDSATGEERNHSLRTDAGGVECAEFSPDGRFLLTTHVKSFAVIEGLRRAHTTVYMWDVATGAENWHLEPEDVSPEYSVVRDYTQGRGTIDCNAQPMVAHFSADGRRVLLKTGNRSVRLLDADTGNVKSSFPAPQGSAIEAAAFIKDGARVLVFDRDTKARELWRLDDDSTIKLTSLEGGSDFKNSAVLSADGRFLLGVTDYDDQGKWLGTFTIWDVASGRLLFAAELRPTEMAPKAILAAIRSTSDGPFVSYSFSADGELVLVGTRTQTGVWSTKDWHPVGRMSSSEHRMRSATFSADGTHLLFVEPFGAELWAINRENPPAKREQSFKGPEGWVEGAAFNPSNETVVTWSDNGAASLWDTRTGREIRVLRLSRSSSALCRDCDIRLSTAAMMSARFPIISPHGNIRNGRLEIVDRVVDGGYFENFGAITALELADELRTRFELKPKVILINNEPTTSGMECIRRDSKLDYPKPDQTLPFALLRSPLSTVEAARGAHGSYAAVELCSSIESDNFAFITVARDSNDPGMTLSMSWWLSKHIQKVLDDQLIVIPDDPLFRNSSAFITIENWLHQSSGTIPRLEPRTTPE